MIIVQASKIAKLWEQPFNGQVSEALFLWSAQCLSKVGYYLCEDISYKKRLLNLIRIKLKLRFYVKWVALKIVNGGQKNKYIVLQ